MQSSCLILKLCFYTENGEIYCNGSRNILILKVKTLEVLEFSSVMDYPHEKRSSALAHRLAAYILQGHGCCANITGIGY